MLYFYSDCNFVSSLWQSFGLIAGSVKVRPLNIRLSTPVG